MKTMGYTESRARYAEVLDGVVNDREEIVITRAGHEPVVIVSRERLRVPEGDGVPACARGTLVVSWAPWSGSRPAEEKERRAD